MSKMNDFLEKLNKGEILICDGAMGTMLQKKGLKPGDCPEEWNITHSKEIIKIHNSYLDVGADIILTNTFGGNSLKLKACGREDKTREYNLKGVKNARDSIEICQVPAQRTTIYILGDIGPTGQIMESAGGTLTFEQAKEIFKEQIGILIEGGVDGIIFETFEDIEELKAGIAAAKEIGVDFPIIASMTFHPGARGFRTIMGVSVEDAVKGLVDCNVDIIGTNCGNGPKEVVEIIKEMHKFTDLPLISEPNAGVPVLKEGKTVFPMGPEDMAKFIPQLIESGVNIIGGCCGTTPEHIKKVVECSDAIHRTRKDGIGKSSPYKKIIL